MDCEFICGCERGRIRGDMYRQTDVTLRVAYFVARRAGKHAVATVLGTICPLHAQQYVTSGDTPGRQPPFHRLLPELLGHTFSFLDEDGEIASAQTNRLWAYASIKHGRDNPQKIMESAARAGDLALLKYISATIAGKLPVLQSSTGTVINATQLLHYAVLGGHLHIIKYLVEEHHPDLTATVQTSRPSRVKHAFGDQLNALSFAAKKGNLAIVTYLVTHGADVHAMGEAALHWAAEKKHLNVVKYLVDEHQANIAQQGDTPDALHFAVSGTSWDVVKYLVTRGAAIHARHDEALRMAAWVGNLGAVQFLVEHGANANAARGAAMINASARGHLAAVQFLDVHVTYHYAPGDSLLKAAQNNHLPVVEFIMGAHTGLWAPVLKALHAAAKRGYVPIVEHLVEHGDDIELHRLSKILRLAAGYRQLAVVEFLIKHGASIHALNDSVLSSAAINGHDSVVAFLLDRAKFARSAIKNAMGLAAYRRHLEIVKLLLPHLTHAVAMEVVVNVSKPDIVEWVRQHAATAGTLDAVIRRGMSPALPARRGSLVDINYYVKHGANVRAEDDLALRMATEHGHLPVIKFLLGKGADIHAANNEPLRVAVERADLPVVKYLLAKARGFSKLAFGHAVDLAVENRHWEVIKLLFAQGARGHHSQVMGAARSAGNQDMIRWLTRGRLGRALFGTHLFRD